jgi:hypothetical protein
MSIFPGSTTGIRGLYAENTIRQRAPLAHGSSAASSLGMTLCLSETSRVSQFPSDDIEGSPRVSFPLHGKIRAPGRFFHVEALAYEAVEEIANCFPELSSMFLHIWLSSPTTPRRAGGSRVVSFLWCFQVADHHIPEDEGEGNTLTCSTILETVNEIAIKPQCDFLIQVDSFHVISRCYEGQDVSICVKLSIPQNSVSHCEQLINPLEAKADSAVFLRTQKAVALTTCKIS